MKSQVSMSGTTTRQPTDTQGGNLESLHNRILDAAMNLMSSDMASMQWLDPERNQLRYSRGRDFIRNQPSSGNGFISIPPALWVSTYHAAGSTAKA